MIPKITQSKLDALAAKYAEKLKRDVETVLSNPEFMNTGELADSIEVSITKATDQEAPLIVLTYADQGYFLNYRNPQWTKLPTIAKLEKWGSARGLDFGNIPGYEYGTAPNLSDEKKVERIVWAIAKNKRKEDSWKPRLWKRKANLVDFLNKLNNETVQAYAKDVETILAEAISMGMVLS